MTDENDRKIIMAHGSGGRETAELIKNVFSENYGNEYLSQMEDATVVPGRDKIAVTTDSFVVSPLFFKGGDIGRLAVCGTVNDLAARGAKPAYLTAGFILEEGLESSLLKRVAESMAETAKEAGVKIVAGDTKVVSGNGGMYINTAGVGLYDDGAYVPGTDRIREGDCIMVTGTVGDHHAAILAARLEIESDVCSDVAPLNRITEALLSDAEIEIHAMRDITRGGLATVLAEEANACGLDFLIEEESIPVAKCTKSFASLMGLDPLYMGNEGKMAIILPQKCQKHALDIIKACNYGADSAIIGKVVKNESPQRSGGLFLKTGLGGMRSLGVMTGEGLPRIC